jgi:hypothetical protein
VKCCVVWGKAVAMACMEGLACRLEPLAASRPDMCISCAVTTPQISQLDGDEARGR